MNTNRKRLAVGGALLGCVLLCVVGVRWIRWASGHSMHDLVSDVPLGTKLSELDRYIRRGSVSEGEVYRWTLTDPKSKANSEVVKNAKGVPFNSVTENQHGTFLNSFVGPYNGWPLPLASRDTFTGEIIFYGAEAANSFVFINGKLASKDWGFLPG